MKKFIILPVWLKRWKELARIKTSQNPEDERLVQFCKEFGDKLAGRELEEEEEIEIALLPIPSHDLVEIKKYLLEVIDVFPE